MKLTDEDGKEYEYSRIVGEHNIGLLVPIKPKTKKIDMSVCIESGILCEFIYKQSDKSLLGKLIKIENGRTSPYKHNSGEHWERCQPAMNGHIHANPIGWSKCPVPDGYRVRVWFSNYGGCSEYNIHESPIQWENVRMFEIIKKVDGYE